MRFSIEVYGGSRILWDSFFLKKASKLLRAGKCAVACAISNKAAGTFSSKFEKIEESCKAAGTFFK